MHRLALAVLLAVVVGALAPEAACEDRVWVRPSLSVSEEYDTNVDLDQRNRSDFLTAFRPGIELQLTDYPWDVRLTGYMRGELYARRPELNNVENFGVSGAVGLRPERPLSLSLTGNFTRSVYAAEVDPVAGVNRGRDVSYGYTVSPALQWAIDPRTSLGASYSGSFYWSDASGTNDSDTHAFGLSGSHQLTQRLSGTASYTFSRFVIDHDPNSDSHAPRVGLSYAISPVSGVSGSIGPNVLVEEGGGTRVTLGGSFSYNQRFKDGGFSVAYNAANTASGTVGEAATTHSLTASLGVQFIRLLSFSVDGGGTYNDAARGSRGDYQTYRAGVRASYQLLRWLSLDASCRYERQDGRSSSTVQDYDRAVFSLGLTASDRFRVY